jgi:hypothetical protein
MFLVPNGLKNVMVLNRAFPLELKATDELVRVTPGKSELKSLLLATNPSLTLVIFRNSRRKTLGILVFFHCQESGKL